MLKNSHGLEHYLLRSPFIGSVFGLCACILAHGSAAEQQSPDELLGEAVELYNGPDTPIDTLNQIRNLLERIIVAHPASDLAVDIALQQSPPGLDLAAIERRAGPIRLAVPVAPDSTATAEGGAGSVSTWECIADAIPGEVPQTLEITAHVDGAGRITGLPELVRPASPDTAVRTAFLAAAGALDACAPYPEGVYEQAITVRLEPDGATEVSAMPGHAEAEASPTLAPGSEEAQASLDLGRQDIRDIQARLLVLGHDPNGIDGLIGPGTRSALMEWQEKWGANPNGQLSASQLAQLERTSQAELEAWLEDPENARLHTPPPPIALSPGNVSGRWQFTTTCGANSQIGAQRINGIMSIQHVGGSRYTGTVRQSQGLRGEFSGRLTGRTLRAEVNWGFLLGKVQVNGRFADQSMTVRGMDSNGCRFVSRKS